MASNRKLLSVVVVIGVAIGIVSQLRWMAKLEKGAESGHTPTNAVAKVAATNAVPAAATNVAAKVERTILPNSQTPKPSNSQTLKLSNLQTPQTPKPPRKPIAYDPKIPKARQVLLANRRIAVASGRSFPEKFCATQMPTARRTAPYVLISEVPVSRDVRIQAVADGAKVVGFLPNNALLVEADAQALKYLEEDPMFTAAVEYEPTDKIQRAVMEGEKGERGESGERAGETVEATVVLLNVADREAVRKFIVEKGGREVAGVPSKGKAVMAEIPRALVADLAKKAEVKWIEKFGRLKLNNDQAVLPQVLNVSPVWNAHGLTGEGQVIATLDSGIDTGEISTLNADFRNRVVEIYNAGGICTADYGGHGTHTAGSLVGTGANSSGQFKGVAHGAQLFVLAGGDKSGSGYIYFDGLETWEDLFTFGRGTYGYGVKSDSWGVDGDGDAAFLSSVVDACIWEDPELLEVFAAGNDGYDVYKTVDAPATAKNCLAVGSTGNRRFYARDAPNDDNIYTMSSYSSLGPTADGRIKPDVCAPGEYVVSVMSAKAVSGSYFAGNKNYQYMSGTSMATPLAAGCAALVREWLMKRRGYGETKPTAALVKAVLTGGAFDISGKAQLGWQYGAAPSNYQGWGRVDLEASIFPTNGLAVYVKDRLPFDAGETFSFAVTTTNAASLRAQLVWIDHAAEEGAGLALNNNLDLTVVGGAQTWLGNGGTEGDALNTVESVRIENAAAGRYVVKVTCPTVPYPHTEGGAAAIYIRGAFDPEAVVEETVTEAQIAARQSPSKPVFLFDAGLADAPGTADGWMVADLNGQPSFSVATNGIAFSHAADGGKFWNNSTTNAFSSGSFADIYGRTWANVEEEMLVSLGLRGTKETDLARFFKTGINMGAGTGEKTVNVTGLSPDKRYVLFYMACDGTNKKTGKFKLRGGYAGTPTVEYVTESATGYATGAAGTAVTAGANVPLLVRVTDLRPDALGKVVIDVGGATANVLAVAEMSRPSCVLIVRTAAR